MSTSTTIFINVDTINLLHIAFENINLCVFDAKHDGKFDHATEDVTGAIPKVVTGVIFAATYPGEARPTCRVFNNFVQHGTCQCNEKAVEVFVLHKQRYTVHCTPENVRQTPPIKIRLVRRFVFARAMYNIFGTSVA
jgi:hypothetical protein